VNPVPVELCEKRNLGLYFRIPRKRVWVQKRQLMLSLKQNRLNARIGFDCSPTTDLIQSSPGKEWSPWSGNNAFACKIRVCKLFLSCRTYPDSADWGNNSFVIMYNDFPRSNCSAVYSASSIPILVPGREKVGIRAWVVPQTLHLTRRIGRTIR
jgi:hypothetical protein